MDKQYFINEIFYSLQGEGMRAGEPSFFVRFRGCNMECDMEPGPKSPGGFICDTEFASGRGMTLQDIYEYMLTLSGECKWIILTGGEPGLQIDDNLIDFFHDKGYKLAIESNGTVELPQGLDFITVSPKCAEHGLKQLTATEVKYVRRHGQAIPQPRIKADHYLISPAWEPGGLDKKNLEWAIDLCKQYPKWRLSCQLHKVWAVR